MPLEEALRMAADGEEILDAKTIVALLRAERSAR